MNDKDGTAVIRTRNKDS